MSCVNGTDLHGLRTQSVEVKCSAKYGTPKWVLLETDAIIPKCLVSCENDGDCNHGLYDPMKSNKDEENRLFRNQPSLSQTANTTDFVYAHCKSLQGGEKRCISSSCFSTSLIRANSQGIEFPQEGSHGGLHRRKDILPLGHLGSLKCDAGYIFNPSELSGELSKELNVKCMEDQICGGTGWKLIDGSDIPECIEGNHNSSILMCDRLNKDKITMIK